MKLELASLAPLQVPRVAVPRERPGEALPSQSLYRKTTQLLETLYQLSANAKVLDVRHSKSSRSYTNLSCDLGGWWHLCVVPLPTGRVVASRGMGLLWGQVWGDSPVSPSGPSVCWGRVAQCPGAELLWGGSVSSCWGAPQDPKTPETPPAPNPGRSNLPETHLVPT